jgi:N-acetylneuraminate lyase/4-hydroxy-tetrahydrodipicolinate synthase
MTTEERKLVAEIAVDECKENDMKAIVHIGSTSTKVSVNLAKHADSIGADAISSVVPFYYTTTFYNDKNYEEHFKSIVDSVSCDVHCYNNVKTTGYDIKPRLLETLIEVGVTGIKDGGSNMGSMLEMIRMVDVDNFDYYPSSTSSLITGFLLGAKACISGVSLTVPDLIVSIYNDMKKSKVDSALETWKKVMITRSYLGEFGGRAISAYDVLNYIGVDVGRCREPWVNMDAHLSKMMIRKLRRVGVLK